LAFVEAGLQTGSLVFSFSRLPLHWCLRIVVVVEALCTHAHLGRAGAEPGIRKLVIGQTPYPIFCRVRGQRITISTRRHAAQKK
jgi:plasmid stabilization system protein ParE